MVSVDTPMITKEAISQLYQFTISQRMEHQADIIAYSDDDKPIPTIAFIVEESFRILKKHSILMIIVYSMYIKCDNMFLDTKEVQPLKIGLKILIIKMI